MQHVRPRANSSPSRPRAGTVGNQSMVSSPPVHEHAEQPQPDGTSMQYKTRKSTFPPLAFFSEPAHQSRQSNPLRMFRERLKRPSSAGGAPERSDNSREGSNLTSPKSPRTKGTRARPSTSSGTPERNVAKQSEETLSSRFSMSAARRRRETSVPPAFPRSSDFAIPTKDNNGNNGYVNISHSLGVHKNWTKTHPPTISNPRPIDAKDLDELETKANLDDTRFSTVDRTILNELKFKMQAREAQFELKNGKRHHPYSAKEVPYPLYYEQSVIDYGIWEVMWMKSVTKDMTWHPLEAVPQKVLDLGCGSGNWILECARQWKDTHFVGLDIVPIQPDLYQLGTSQMASRITWVQANFLERLPFQDEEFDYICARRIARGVPEDKWDGLLEEITRLLRPGGSFELIEEELCFPGKLVYPQPEALVDLDVAISPLPSSDHWMSDPFSSSDSLSPPTSSSSSSHYPPVAYPQAQWPLTRTSSGTSLSPGTSNSPPLTQIVTSHLSLSSRTLSKSPLHRMTLPPTMEEDEHSLHPGSDCAPELREPIDPRDHSLLEFIYNEVHTSRFINLEPLALLQNTFSLYFEDSCIHPPIILTFPPRLNSTSTSLPNTTSEKLDKGTHLDEETNVVSLLASSNPYVLIDDDRFNPFFGKPRSLAPEDSITSIYERFWNGDNDPSRTGSDDDNILGRRRRVLREGHTSRCRKPLEGIDFRLESLNMLLALRVQEVVGCAEEMWSWVAHYQNTQYNSPAVGAGSLWAKEKPYHQTLVQMNRLDFDEIVMRFQLDMQEQIGMGKVVQDRLGWKEVSTARTQAQKEFDMLSAEWIIHKKSLKQKPTSTVTSTMSTPRLDSLSLTDESEGHERLNNVAAPFLSANGKMHPSTDGHGADRSAVPLSSLEPWQRISRKMIVAVGWKAGGKNGP